MLNLAWPWLLVLLPVPWLIARLLAPIRTQSSGALRVPYLLDGLDTARGANPVPALAAMVGDDYLVAGCCCCRTAAMDR